MNGPIRVNRAKLYGDICVFEDVIDVDLCQRIIAECSNQAGWQKSITTGELIGKQNSANSPRQSDSLMMSGNADLKDIDTFVHKVFISSLDQYCRLIGLNGVDESGISEDEGYTVLRYVHGGKYSEHFDYSSVNGAGLIRVFSGLIYLNDDYIGGELNFRRHSLKIKPKAGMVVIFPSICTHVHSSELIKAGTKFTIVTWWH